MKICSWLAILFDVLVHATQDGLKLNGTRQLLAYADDVDILGGGIHNLKENSTGYIVSDDILIHILVPMITRLHGVTT